MIEIDNISFSYGQKKIFDQLSLTFPNKGMVTIIGPNGCGKSTLMQLISGDLKPSSGRIRLEGDNVHEINVLQVAKRLAYCRQKIQVEFPMACIDYLLLGRRPYKARFNDFNSDDYHFVEEVLYSTDTESFIHSKLNELSGGECQRINFAKILIQDTPLMIFDESFSAMDLKYRLLCLDLLKEKSKEKLIVSVLHDLNLAYLYSDYMIVMKAGQIMTSGHNVLTEALIKDVYEVEVEFIENKGFYLGGR